MSTVIAKLVRIFLAAKAMQCVLTSIQFYYPIPHGQREDQYVQPTGLKRRNEEGKTRFILRLHSSLRRWQLLHWILKQPSQQVHRAFEGTGGPLYKDAQTKRHRLPAKPQNQERGDETRTTDQNVHS
jgi:hypothetical protein